MIKPGLLKLQLQEVTDGFVLGVVVDGPIDAQLAVLANQLQHGAEALRHVELGILAALLPGVHGQELQPMLGWQGALPLDHLVALGKQEKADVLVHVGNTTANASPGGQRGSRD